MATDATGTPSANFSFPKYNVAVDAPSGNGLNAIVDDIDTKLNDQFVHSSDAEVTHDVPVWNGTGWTFQKVNTDQLEDGSVTAVKMDSGAATDGQVATADGAGGVAWETPTSTAFVGARVYHNANQSISDVTNTALALNSERYDTDAFHDTVTNNSRLTVPAGQAGKYRITGNAAFAVTADKIFALKIRLNGATNIAYATEHTGASTGDNVHINLSTTYDLVATDYVELVAWHNTGAAANVLAVSNVSPEFMLEKIG